MPTFLDLLASGIYLYRITSVSGYTDTKRMTLLKQDPHEAVRRVRHDVRTKCPAETNSVGFSFACHRTVKHGWKAATC